MTRNEFIENVTTWWELKDICGEYGCNYLDDVYNDEERDEYIEDYLNHYANEHCWRDLRDRLCDIPDGDGFFQYNYWDDWYELGNNDFENYKGDVLEWMDDNEMFDEEEDDTDMIEDEGLDAVLLAVSCQSDFLSVVENEKKQKEESQRQIEESIRKMKEAEDRMVETWGASLGEWNKFFTDYYSTMKAM